MPYNKRKRTYKKYTRKRRSVNRPVYSSSASASNYRKKRTNMRNTRVSSYNGTLGVEKKFLDCAANNLALVSSAGQSTQELNPTTGCTNCLSAPAQGDGASNRDGAKIIGKSLQITGIVGMPAQTNQTLTDTTPIIYLAVVLDMQTNGGTATGIDSENVYQNVGANSNLCATPLRNMSFSTRYQVLKLKKIRLPVPSVTWDGTNIEQAGVTVPFDIYLNLKNLPIKFTSGSTTADVSSVIDNSLHLIGGSSDQGGLPVIYYQSRFRFIG